MTTTNFELLADDIRRQPDFLRASIPEVRRIAEAVATQLGDRPSCVYLVGCGDSLNVGMATRFAWQQAAGLPVEAVPALTFSRFVVGGVPADALVIALSQSGTVSRVVEVVRRSRNRGLNTIAITGSPESPLAREPSNQHLVMAFPKLGFVPGTTSYVFNLVVFYELAAAVGGRFGSSQTPDEIRSQVDMLPELIANSLDSNWDVARTHADAIDRDASMLILGAGPQLANAHFLARKMFEVTQITALSQETEEYAHDEISIVDERMTAVQFLPVDDASDRALEILDSLLELGCATAVVTERGSAPHIDSRVTWRYEVDRGLNQLCNAALFALPPSLFTYEVALAVGGSYYATNDPVHAKHGDRLIYGSQVLA